MCYSGPNKPLTPISDPYQMFGKLYRRSKDRGEREKYIPDDLQGELPQRRVHQRGRTGVCWMSTRRSFARWSVSSS